MTGVQLSIRGKSSAVQPIRPGSPRSSLYNKPVKLFSSDRPSTAVASRVTRVSSKLIVRCPGTFTGRPSVTYNRFRSETTVVR